MFSKQKRRWLAFLSLAFRPKIFCPPHNFCSKKRNKDGGKVKQRKRTPTKKTKQLDGLSL